MRLVPIALAALALAAPATASAATEAAAGGSSAGTTAFTGTRSRTPSGHVAHAASSAACRPLARSDG